MRVAHGFPTPCRVVHAGCEWNTSTIYSTDAFSSLSFRFSFSALLLVVVLPLLFPFCVPFRWVVLLCAQSVFWVGRGGRSTCQSHHVDCIKSEAWRSLREWNTRCQCTAHGKAVIIILIWSSWLFCAISNRYGKRTVCWAFGNDLWLQWFQCLQQTQIRSWWEGRFNLNTVLPPLHMKSTHFLIQFNNGAKTRCESARSTIN